MRKHSDFILTPITNILKEATFSTSNVEMGIDSYPLSDYIMQALFLKMTGFQEQKMKCVSWELATDDYELRYLRYKKKPLGECSSLDEKNIVFADLCDQLEKCISGSSVIEETLRQQIIDETKSEIKEFFIESRLQAWSQKSYYEYEKLISNCDKSCILFCGKTGGRHSDLIGHCDNCSRKKSAANGAICTLGKMRNVVDTMIDHRNRCAHNISSYQQNLPSLETMTNPKYVFENYFLRFFCLILIDKIFIILFNRYLEQHPEPFSI